MADDELNAPLGQNTKGKRHGSKLPVAVPRAIAGALGLFVSACAIWALVVDDPLGGEPVVVVATEMAPVKGQPNPAAAIPEGMTQGPRSYDGPAGQPATRSPVSPPPAQPATAPPPGTKIVTIIDGSTGQRQEVAIPTTQDARAPIEPRLLEHSRHGAIPRIGPKGALPAEVYARAVKAPPDRAGGPRIAVVLGGLGVSDSVTRQAIETLPGAVTFAFPPYGLKVDRDVTRARAEGHEVLLQVPMEPFDYPDNDPGPQTLLTSLSADQNLDRLHWLMSRIQGYVGIANYMGTRFTASAQALTPVLKETAKRGLIYVDDGSSSRSLASGIAGTLNMPYVKSQIALDAVPVPEQIDQALTRLETMAREHGAAVGFASALPVSIERIAQWAKAAEARGIALVPISAIAVRPKSS